MTRSSRRRANRTAPESALPLLVLASGRLVGRQVEVGELLGEAEMGATGADVLEV
ncbi:MAG: hypothetical protein M3071_10160 [Actinomycetota bacterium]|nr:hypothetical protein [Actinomycetota bacterium]